MIADKMAAQQPPGLLGIHVNMPATVPPGIAKRLKAGDPPPRGLSDKEKAAYQSLNNLYTRGGGYAAMMVTRPQTIGYALADSPVGQAAWMYDKFADWTYSGGDPERSLSKDEVLDDITLYWLTNTSTSAAQLYWTNNANNFNSVNISIPAAVTVFPGEIYQAPRSWLRRSRTRRWSRGDPASWLAIRHPQLCRRFAAHRIGGLSGDRSTFARLRHDALSFR
ncbi:hypothetical protein QF002_008594 [Paraburkholderia youngii]